MKTKKIDAYKANARDNAGKTRNAAEIAVGDFLYLVTGYENGFRDYIRTPERDEDRTVYGYPMGIFGNIGYRCLNVNFFGE